MNNIICSNNYRNINNNIFRIKMLIIIVIKYENNYKWIKIKI